MVLSQETGNRSHYISGLGHGYKFERISSNFNFEWTKFIIFQEPEQVRITVFEF